MKQFGAPKLIIAVCLGAILLTLFSRSVVYKTTDSVSPVTASPTAPSAENSKEGAITVHFHERRPFYMSYKDEIHGLVADPIALAFEYAEIPFQWQDTPATRQLDIIKKNQDKSCAAGWFKTPERETYARYTLPVYQDKPFVAVTRNNNELIAEVETLARVLSEHRLQLLVKEGYSYGNYIDAQRKTFVPRQTTTTADNQNILKMIQNYRADYSFMTEEEAYDLLISSGMNSSNFKVVHFSDMPQGNRRYIICSKQVEPEIIEQLNSAIRYLSKIEDD